MSSPEFQTPPDTQKNTYIEGLYKKNERYLAELRMQFTDFILPLDACVVALGSDGKKERHIQSKTELLIITREGKPTLSEELKSYVYNITGKPYESQFDSFGGEIEVKSLSQETPFSFAFSEKFTRPHLIFPDRVLNTQIVVGSGEVHHDARLRVIKEMGRRNALGHKIRERIKRQIMESVHSVSTGRLRKEVAFTHSDTGEQPSLQFYDENPSSYTTGFKGPFLRGAQRSVDLITARLILDGSITPEELTKTFPTPTIDRMQYLRRRNVQFASPSIEDSFAWFLQEYHNAQEAYRNNPHETAKVPFEYSQFQAHSREVLALMTSFN